MKYILDKLPHATPTATLAGIIDDYCSIANTGNAGRSESELAEEIGTLAPADSKVGAELGGILTDANCRSGMQAYIAQFEGGILQQLAGEIQDNGAYIDRVGDRFNADAANWVWNTDTADEKIRDVILDYHIIAESNKSLTPRCTDMADVVRGWNLKTSNIHIAYDAMKAAVGELAPLLEMLCTIRQSNALPEQQKVRFYELLLSQREAFDRFYADQLSVFKQVAEKQLDGLDDKDIADLYGSFTSGQFIMSSGDYSSFIKGAVEKYISTQLKQQVRQLWEDKTGTKTPMAWSSEYRTPISCMFGGDVREHAKQIFDIINKESPTDDEANRALRYLTNARFYERLADASERDRCFMQNLVGDYATLLDDPDAVRQYLQDHTTVQPYDWLDNATVTQLIHAMAEQKYRGGDNKRAQAVIDDMEPDTLREYLKDLISDNVRVGIEILKSSRGGEAQ